MAVDSYLLLIGEYCPHKWITSKVSVGRVRVTQTWQKSCRPHSQGHTYSCMHASDRHHAGDRDSHILWNSYGAISNSTQLPERANWKAGFCDLFLGWVQWKQRTESFASMALWWISLVRLFDNSQSWTPTMHVPESSLKRSDCRKGNCCHTAATQTFPW